ncbi:uncharacterized protein LOC100179197 [Ciona intestinalis]
MYAFKRYGLFCTLLLLVGSSVAQISNLSNCSRTEANQGPESVIEVTCTRLGFSTITRPFISSLLHENIRRNEGKQQRGVVIDTVLSKRSFNIKLEDLNVAEIADGSFADAKDVKVLNLVGNAIQQLKPLTMTGLTSLKNLFLGSNDIGIIYPGSFVELRSLDWLDLSRNRISEFSYTTFMGLSMLKSLNLEYNNISAIQTAGFGALLRLENLYLEGNRISSIDGGSLAGMYSLQFLSLKRNDLSRIDDGTFAGNPQLTQLDLSYNRITEIKSSTFVGLTSLRILKLNGNMINTIKDHAFTHVPQLSELDLSHNALTTLRRNMFLGLVNIHVLDISENWMHGTALSTDNTYGSPKSDLIEAIGIICRKPGLYFTNLRSNGLIPMLNNVTQQALGFDFSDGSQHFCVF